MKNLEQILLFDFYGNLLTEKQAEALDLYLNEDMSLTEIADSHNITRQGVRDNINRALNLLEEYEEKLGFVSKFQNILNKAEDAKTLLNNLSDCMGANDITKNRNLIKQCKTAVQAIIDTELSD